MLDGELTEIFQSAGIDPARYESSDLPEAVVPSEEELVAEKAQVEAKTAEEDGTEGKEQTNETDIEQAEEVTEGEETTEAPVEEPKLTAKEFREIEAARVELETQKAKFQDEIKLERQQLEAQYGEKVRDFDQFDAFLTHLAETNPHAFDEFKEHFGEYQKVATNPVIDKVSREMAELRKELGQFKAKASDEVTRTKLDAEINQVKSTLGKDAEAKGLKVDWSKVEDFWADNPKSNIESAFFALYGKQLVTAATSKAKVEASEKKLAARPSVSTAGTVRKSTAPVQKDYSKMSYDEATNAILQEVLGKRVS